MPHRVCANCSAEFACPASFRGKNPKCSGCRATHPQRQHAPAHGGGAPQNGAGMPGNLMGPRQQGAGAPQVNPFTGAHQPGMMEMQQQMHLMAQAQRGGGQAHASAHGGGAPQNGAAGSAPRHMTPCACHCAACRAAGHGNTCVMVSLALVQLFPENADIVDLVLRHYYHGASGWDTARFDSKILSVQYGPAGDVIAAGDSDGRIHLICTQTGAKILCLKGHR